MSVKQHPELILFDLGGVLVELKPSPFPDAWLGGGRTFDGIDWFRSETAIQFERGELATGDFAAGLQRELGLQAGTGEILDAFARWPIGLFNGAQELLMALRKSYRLAALTNTNPLHWPRLVGEFQLPRYFSEIFASHRMQLAKPDPRAFLHVLESTGAEPERVLFFDDNPVNVAAAAEVGMVARRAGSVGDVRRELAKLGLLRVN